MIFIDCPLISLRAICLTFTNKLFLALFSFFQLLDVVSVRLQYMLSVSMIQHYIYMYTCIITIVSVESGIFLNPGWVGLASHMGGSTAKLNPLPNRSIR